MAKLGEMNVLDVIKLVDFGAYVDGGDLGEILVPKKFLPENTYVGMELDLFVYKDSEDRLIATTQHPYLQVGEFASLKVISTGTVGAFLDWGLEKDLLLPYSEQRDRVEEGRYYVVGAYIDNSGRIAASARVERHLENLANNDGLMEKYRQIATEGTPVSLLIYSRSQLGYNAIINNEVAGLIFRNECFKELKVGERLTAYIKMVREDGKIDLMLERPGYGKIEGFSDKIFCELKKANGFLPLNDKSDPEEIAHYFEMSKKNFKKSIGALYKEHKIEILEDGIRLVK